VAADGPSPRRLVASVDAARLHAPLRPTRSAAAPWLGALLLAGGLVLLVRRRDRAAPAPSPQPRPGRADAGDDDPTSDDLADAYAKLQELDRQKDAFLSSVSHEFRTPLSSIRSFSEILLNYENEDPTTMREFLSIIHEESERLSRLVNDLLDLTKIESGCAEWRMTRVDLGPLVETVLRSASSLARQNGVELFAHVRDELPAVEADRDRLHQVLTNLVSNALKFSPEQGRIDVRVGIEDGRLRIDVEDEGPGVPEEDRERIFEKFHQARQPDGDAPRGTGLGLPISREIVQHHGGLLWVEPRPTGGSRFTFTLPVPVRVS
ncbi:MAG: sensor histidine kinase, partial [Planctomycetota bacterium JB042]